MRYASDDQGNRLFTVADFLKPKQIQSFFSRMASKAKQNVLSDLSEEELQQNKIAAEEENTLDNARRTVSEQVGLRHPIVCDTVNLCNLVHSNSLTKQSVATLKWLCQYFDLNTSNLKTHRLKAPYMALLIDLVQTCSCFKDL